MPVTLHCLADVCIVPIGTGSASVSDEITAITDAGTTIDGPWNEVMDLIGQMHELLHSQGVVRIQSDIRVGTRTDKTQSPADKLRIVEEKLKQKQK
ncbi:hypothetical protein ABC855_g392 [[Candida] zeylanoides]